MSGGACDYIRYRLERARGAIEVAESLLAGEHRPDAVSKLYYACFYAVTALLASQGLSASRHKTAVSLFGEHWVQSGRFPREMGRFLRAMLERRLHSDYENAVAFEQAEVESWLTETKTFVARIEAYLQGNTADSE